MKIANKTVATLRMKVTDQDGVVLEDTPEDDPFVYLHGAHGILPALEKALAGKKAGDVVEITLSPDEAYGARDESLVQSMSVDQFEGIETLEVGLELEGETDDGLLSVTVTAIDGDDVTVDANHPFAGKTLSFVLTLTGVREATKEEIDHGHAHTNGHEH